VDTETQMIWAADCTNQAANAPHQLPLRDQVMTNVARAPQGVLVDAGYPSDAHLEAAETRGIDALIPPEKVRHRVRQTVRALCGRQGGARLANLGCRLFPARVPGRQSRRGSLGPTGRHDLGAVYRIERQPSR